MNINVKALTLVEDDAPSVLKVQIAPSRSGDDARHGNDC